MTAVICLLGPSAAGKTRIAIQLAQIINAEIISVDSVLVYRRLDIGSAKPSKEERAQVVHHLIDICDIHETYNAARFLSDAHAAIERIQKQGKHVLLVGGTMMYFHLLCQGMPEMPEQMLNTTLTSQQMHAALAKRDPEAFARLHPNDTTRVSRAYFLAAKGMTQLDHWQQPMRYAPVRAPTLCLAPTRRQLLDERIEARIDQMFATGFVAEVQALVAQQATLLHQPPKPLTTIGYAQVLDYIKQGERDRLSAVKQRIFYATRAFVKRQTTWLNKLAIDMSFDCLATEQKSVQAMHEYLLHAGFLCGDTNTFV